MRFLLDTHIWLWLLDNPSRIGARAGRLLGASSNDVWLSPVSLWEVLALVQKARLRVDPDAASWLRSALSRLFVREASLTHDVALALTRITTPHRDPADRFLAATAHAYDLTLLTADDDLLAGTGYKV